MRMLPPAVKNLLIVNIIVFLGTLLIGDPMYQYFALFPVGSHYFRWWQFVTHMFMHGNFAHIFFNMWSLIVFGPVLERMWGSKKFLLYYFVCGLGAA
ncbi:MAG: rhomboid family intramembrane serine protease, partial [Bacteroidales bacterium]|nr:rhomboid family intramembrane serine protease [Bacteroidales bacterium]